MKLSGISQNIEITDSQIQYYGFKRARMRKSGDMSHDQVRILYLLLM